MGIMFCLIVLFIASCTTPNGPKYTEIKGKLPMLEPEMSRFYFCRARHIACPANVYLNNKNVGKSGSGCFFYIDVVPSYYHVWLTDPDGWAEGNDGGIWVQSCKGETLYVWMRRHDTITYINKATGTIHGKHSLVPVLEKSAQQAIGQMSDLKYWGAKAKYQ